MIHAIIPARAGSKGVKGKNIKLLNGKPLIAYSIESCLASKNIDRVIVSTDSKEIADIAKQFGAEIPFMRPDEFATDLSSDWQFLDHFFSIIDVPEVALMRPTTPIRKVELIDKAIEKYFDIHTFFTGMRSVTISEENPYKMFKINSYNICEGFFEDYNGIYDYTNRPRQIFPEAYTPNGYIDIVKKETVEFGSSFGNTIVPFITPRVPDIDTEDDFKFAERFVNE